MGMGIDKMPVIAGSVTRAIGSADHVARNRFS